MKIPQMILIVDQWAYSQNSPQSSPSLDSLIEPSSSSLLGALYLKIGIVEEWIYKKFGFNILFSYYKEKEITNDELMA